MKKIFTKELLIYSACLMFFTVVVPEYLSLIFNDIKLGDSPDFGLGLFSIVVAVALSFNVARRTNYFNVHVGIKILILNILYLLLSLSFEGVIYGHNLFSRTPVILMFMITVSTIFGRVFNGDRKTYNS